MSNVSGPPWKITIKELRNIARNVHTSLNETTNNADRTIAGLRAQALLGHAGVPKHLWPDAAVEAEYRASFSQEPEKSVEKLNINGRLLRIVKEAQLGRDPWPDKFMRG